eukprot:TRINITY_DN1785_c0_g1_i1.p1 TRINITY_DN1785_c0_g1~~TRINITY_DN1785_c0_g1_i1.p1  ORF type:complete len:609 (+),score=53.46 TRINITY_DN1785_c0_g1_i1:1378-3204(+)
MKHRLDQEDPPNIKKPRYTGTLSNILVSIPNVLVVRSKTPISNKPSHGQLIVTSKPAYKSPEPGVKLAKVEVEKRVNAIRITSEKAGEISYNVSNNDAGLSKNQEKLKELERLLADADTEIEELKKQLAVKSMEHDKEFETYKSQFQSITLTHSSEKAKAEAILEEKAALENDVQKVHTNLNESKATIKNKKENIAQLKTHLKENEEINKRKQIEIKQLRKEHSELLCTSKELLREHEQKHQNDIQQEYEIHKMKGKLYSILVSDLDKSLKSNENAMVGFDLLELKPEGSAWTHAKFDLVIDRTLDLCENFEYAKYWVELTQPMVSSCVGMIEGSNCKELTYFVLSAFNKFKLLADYIEGLINAIKGGKGTPITIKARALDTPAETAKRLFGIGEIRTFLDFAHSKCNNRIVTIEANGTVLKYVLIDTIDSRNLENIQRRIKETRRSKTPLKAPQKPAKEFHKILASVQAGYLIMLMDFSGKTLSKDHVPDLNRIMETAKLLSEYVVTAKFSYSKQCQINTCTTHRLFERNLSGVERKYMLYYQVNLQFHCDRAHKDPCCILASQGTGNMTQEDTQAAFGKAWARVACPSSCSSCGLNGNGASQVLVR